MPEALGTAIVAVIVFAILALLVISLVKERRGKSSSGCAGCSFSGSCPHAAHGGCRISSGEKALGDLPARNNTEGEP